jgi:hypothetical protein
MLVRSASDSSPSLRSVATAFAVSFSKKVNTRELRKQFDHYKGSVSSGPTAWNSMARAEVQNPVENRAPCIKRIDQQDVVRERIPTPDPFLRIICRITGV